MPYQPQLSQDQGAGALRPGDSKAPLWLSFNVHGTIAHCSEPLAELLGCNAAEIHGGAITTLLPELPVNGNSSRQMVTEMMTNYVNRSHPMHLSLADGQTLPVDASITSVFVATGPLFIVQLWSAAGQDE